MGSKGHLAICRTDSIAHPDCDGSAILRASWPAAFLAQQIEWEISFAFDEEDVLCWKIARGQACRHAGQGRSGIVTG